MAVDKVIFHSSIRPKVPPGVHLLDSLQQIRGASGVPEDVSRRLHAVEVTAPRVDLPGTEIFGVFPPPNSQGPYAGRLAQIVLKRRTLPWERSAPSTESNPSAPWLALVMLADGEAQSMTVDVSQAFTAGVADTLPALPTGVNVDAIEVVQSVVDRAFPAEEELEFLAHAREVDVSDSEYADEDGFVSVVLSNRIPQPGVAYGCYLISLEGQLGPGGALPSAGTVSETVTSVNVFDRGIDDLFVVPRLGELASDAVVSIADTSVGAVAGSTITATNVAFSAHASTGGGTGTGFRIDGATPAGNATSASTRATERELASVAVVGRRTGFVRQDFDIAKYQDLRVAEGLPPEKTYRFPVLAQWSFEAADIPGDFKAYLENIDVAMIGDARRPADDPRARVPVTTATGHIAVGHTDRRGRAGKAWYRGAFAPIKVTREPAGTPYHIADQARRVSADGREDLSLASAFELGRLLAMSDLQFLRAARSWARRSFGALLRDNMVRPQLERYRFEEFDLPDLSRFLAIQALARDGIGGDPRVMLGEPLLRHEAGELQKPGDIDVLTRGFPGVSRDQVANVLGADVTTATVEPGVDPGGDGPTFDDILAGGAGEGLRDLLVNEIADQRIGLERLGALIDEGGTLGEIFR